jgi:hypothetical protein
MQRQAASQSPAENSLIILGLLLEAGMHVELYLNVPAERRTPYVQPVGV